MFLSEYMLQVMRDDCMKLKIFIIKKILNIRSRLCVLNDLKRQFLAKIPNLKKKLLEKFLYLKVL